MPGAGAGRERRSARGGSVVRVRAGRRPAPPRAGPRRRLRRRVRARARMGGRRAHADGAHSFVRAGSGHEAGGGLRPASGAPRGDRGVARRSAPRSADRFLEAATFLRFRRLMSDVLLLVQAAADTTRAYGEFPVIGARAAVWIAAEVHLMFAAFVLGVPMFAVVTEAIGIFGGDERYDRLSKEFTRLLLVAYSATAIWGAMLVFGLSTLYPRFWAYLTTIFAPSMWAYAGRSSVDRFTLYLYYYGWDRWKKGRAKLGHWTLGILLNVWGTIVMFIANAWLTYMMSPPRDITPTTDPTTIKLWHAIANATWMPINVHRVIANVVFGGAIVGAYASYRFLAARTDEERAHYDWMGYVGNFIAMSALIVLPFSGYWLGRQIYQYDQSLGITIIGSFMSWLWVIQAFLIAVLFLTGNYYLWIGMGRIPGAERFRPYTKWLLVILVLGAIVWGTPHTMIADSKELAAMGGSHHPFLGALGAMSAQNTALNLMILTTFLAFLLYPRANTRPGVAWPGTVTIIQGGTCVVPAAGVLLYG